MLTITSTSSELVTTLLKDMAIVPSPLRKKTWQFSPPLSEKRH